MINEKINQLKQMSAGKACAMRCHLKLQMSEVEQW